MTEVMIVENIPMHLNLGDPSSIIGRATVYKDTETNLSRLEVQMGWEGTLALEHLQEIAEFRAIGFAGIMRRPQSGP